jgi:type II secretory pathway pseudopilin PulG
MIVVVIIGILAAIAIPIFANQQKSALVAGVKSDVKNANASIVAALAKSPTAPDIKTLNASIVKSDPDTIITVGGTWDNYYIHATNKNIGAASTAQLAEEVTTTTPAKTRNIPITNSDFESGISGWVKIRGEEVAHETTNPITGAGSLKLGSPNGTTQPVVQQIVNTPVKAGDVISISTRYKTVGTNSDQGAPGRLYFQAGGRSSTKLFIFPNSNATVATATATPSVDDTSVEVSIYASSDTGSVLYVDDITGTITTPGVTTTTPAGKSYTQTSTGFGVVYSSAIGKIATQNG